ncbi:hypothetical protein HAALTHF_26530n [Vreelandella aquamarina]|nr:hypothetical protein HAALTHF_26530n [Halomonas axialensis]
MKNRRSINARVAAGENPYPAKAPWRSLAPPTLTEHLPSALDGYPYPIKAVIGCMANPIYGQAGLKGVIVDKLKDPKRLGLFVAVDGFINEDQPLRRLHRTGFSDVRSMGLCRLLERHARQADHHVLAGG